jgi:predicted rRNA methylase
MMNSAHNERASKQEGRKPQLLLGFHAVQARLRHAADTLVDIYVDSQRRDRRMLDFLHMVEEKNVKVHPVPSARLQGMAGTDRHQGVVARAEPIPLARGLDELLDEIQGPPLLLILDGVTDPHNLGACLRVADGAGAHAVIAPKDRSVGINTTVTKVASGAAETVPYLTVTNLARTLRELQDRGFWLIGTDDEATGNLYSADFTGPVALIMGAEGEGLRRLTKETCDILINIPMMGSVESLNVSVASGVCLYEARRQRMVKNI